MRSRLITSIAIALMIVPGLQPVLVAGAQDIAGAQRRAARRAAHRPDRPCLEVRCEPISNRCRPRPCGCASSIAMGRSSDQ